jgi:hypothetical protein
VRNATDAATGRTVALWAWPPQPAPPPVPVHPNAIRVWRLWPDKGGQYLVTEAVTGPSLERRLRDGAPVTLSEALSWLRELAGVVDFAHRQGLVHGRLDPGWVRLTYSNHAKLLWPADSQSATADDDRRDFAALADRLLEPHRQARLAAPVWSGARAGRFAGCSAFIAALEGTLWIDAHRPRWRRPVRLNRRIEGGRVLLWLATGGALLTLLTAAAVWRLVRA